ncbi:hypothetical protein [Chenggangzhangella methanolivorans]|uniref:Uncharacterized protein n=1 Tax=Chenggangzhangella methanolivorans TaxID=1437009 RepID=A0A9E6UIM5_9HYPH|nr:hypothetical protein [Chenggangzhangella methanolivorans]QZO01038.1 hypothetical protein K6K41_05455 [Chenggangzhangella methanolivorans]
MNVVQFKRPEPKNAKLAVARRGLAEFAAAMAVIGLVFFLLPTVWSSAPQEMLVVIHLLVAVVYFQQGPRIAAGLWMALTLVCLVMTGAPSPVTYGLSRGAAALDQAATP